MSQIIIVALVCIALASGFEVVQDVDGQEYYLVPIETLHRQRRQTQIDISGAGRGARVTAGHKGNIWKNDNNRLDGGAFVSKHLNPSGPATYGGNLDYTHTPSGSNLNLGAQHTEKFGTDFSAKGTANIWRNDKGNVRLDAVGQYDRHYGGPGGTGKPDYYGGLQLTGTF